MRGVLRWTAIATGLVLMAAAGLGLAAYRRFSGNIRTDRTAERVLAQYAAQRPPALVPGARNILVMGEEGPRSRSGEGVGAGAGGGTGAGAGTGSGAAAAGSGASAGAGSDADAAVLLHLSAGRGRAVVLGVPAALRVRAPEHCGATGAYERFGDAFRRGGAACAIRAFEGFGGVRVDHHLVVDLRGYRRIAAAVGGGDASPGSTVGGDASPASAAGSGGSRGSDGDRRADLLRALAREARGGDGGLAHPARLYGFLDTATSSITADPGLSSLPALYQLAGELRALPPDGIAFRTVPLGAGGAPRVPDADLLLDAVRTDRPPPAPAVRTDRPPPAPADRTDRPPPAAAAAPAARAPAPAPPRSPAPG